MSEYNVITKLIERQRVHARSGIYTSVLPLIEYIEMGDEIESMAESVSRDYALLSEDISENQLDGFFAWIRDLFASNPALKESLPKYETALRIIQRLKKARGSEVVMQELSKIAANSDQIWKEYEEITSRGFVSAFISRMKELVSVNQSYDTRSYHQWRNTLSSIVSGETSLEDFHERSYSFVIPYEKSLRRFFSVKQRPTRVKSLSWISHKFKNGGNLRDVYGFRVSVKDFGHLADFMAFMSKSTANNDSLRPVKVANFIGTESLYQGLNLSFVTGTAIYPVYFEVQIVFDNVHDITSLQHDIIYKNIANVNVPDEYKDMFEIIILFMIKEYLQ